MKKFVAIVSSLLLILPVMLFNVSAATTKTTPNADGMYLRYTFQEIKDNKVIDDINGNDGEIVNGAAIFNDPVRGNVLSLDGTDQHIQMPDAITKDVKALTISAWYKWTDPDDRSWSRVWDIGSDTNDNFFMTPRSGSNTIRFATKLSEWGSAEDVFDGPEPIVDEWVHVAAVMGDGKTAFYLNGELVDEYAVDHTPDGLGDSIQNYLGKSQWPDAYFMGYIDDFILYNKALTAAEVKTLMSADFKNLSAPVVTPAEEVPAEPEIAPVEPETVAEPATTPDVPAVVEPTAPNTSDTTTIIFIAVCALAALACGTILVKRAKVR